MKTCQNLLFRKLDCSTRVWVKAMVTGKVTGNRRPFRAWVKGKAELNKVGLNKILNNEDV